MKKSSQKTVACATLAFVTSTAAQIVLHTRAANGSRHHLSCKASTMLNRIRTTTTVLTELAMLSIATRTQFITSVKSGSWRWKRRLRRFFKSIWTLSLLTPTCQYARSIFQHLVTSWCAPCAKESCQGITFFTSIRYAVASLAIPEIVWRKHFNIFQDITRLEHLIAEQGMHMRLANSTLVVCKLCSYYNNLLFKPPESKTQKADFVKNYTKKWVEHHWLKIWILIYFISR